MLRRSFTPAPSDVAIPRITPFMVRVVIWFSISPASRRDLQFLAAEPCNRRARFRERSFAQRFADREPFGVDELDVAHSEKRQKIAHVCGLGVERRAGVLPASRRGDVHLLAGQKAGRAVRAVLESDTGAR